MHAQGRSAIPEHIFHLFGATPTVGQRPLAIRHRIEWRTNLSEFEPQQVN